MCPAQSKLLRRGRFSEPGRFYLLTTITHQRIPLFHDFHLARQVVRQLRLSDHNQDCRLLAWVVMPDHLHWMLQLGNSLSLSRVVQQMKSFSAHAAGTALWQPGFHDRYR